MAQKHHILISGTGSGLGRFLSQQFPSVHWTRENAQVLGEQLRESGVDVILHCAFNHRKQLADENLEAYLADNVLLTETLCRIPHAKFIFISTIDVYPWDSSLHSEEDPIPVSSLSDIYGLTKRMSEALCLARAQAPLVLRCPALLGPEIRPNSLVRMVTKPGEPLSLSGDSTFNYVSHEAIASLVRLAIDTELTGILNATASGNTTLEEIAGALGLSPRFGTHRYSCGNIDNRRIAQLHAAFRKSSLEYAVEFANTLLNRKS